MESEATPRRKLRRIKPKPTTVRYGYNGDHEGTPEQAAAYWEAIENLRAGRYADGRRVYEQPQPKETRTPNQPTRTMSLPRTRSREMSHAPRRSARSTPKAASRSGDSGDSDPAGSSPAPRWRRFTVDEHFLVVELVA